MLNMKRSSFRTTNVEMGLRQIWRFALSFAAPTQHTLVSRMDFGILGPRDPNWCLARYRRLPGWKRIA